MTIGAVKFFNANKGFGFIRPDGEASDLFVHISGLERVPACPPSRKAGS